MRWIFLVMLAVCLAACASEEENALVERSSQILEAGGIDIPEDRSFNFRTNTNDCETTFTVSQMVFTRDEPGADEHPDGHPLELATPIAEFVSETADRVELYERSFEGEISTRYLAWNTETSANFIFFFGDVGLDYRLVDYEMHGDCLPHPVFEPDTGFTLVDQFTD